jgi:hypothetical protein
MADNTLQDVLDSIKGDAASQAKAQLQQMLSDAKGASQQFVQSCAEQLEQWLIDLHSGEMTPLEFNKLIASQEILARQFVLSQAAATRQRAEELTINLLEFTAEKIAPAVILAL